jgi:hypothetical protein
MECERAGLFEFQRTRSGDSAMAVTQRCLVAMDLGAPSGWPSSPYPPVSSPSYPQPYPPVYSPSFPPSGIVPPGHVWATVLSSSHIQVSWQDTASEAGFRVYSAASPDAPRTFLADLPPDVTTSEVGGLVPNTLYCYWVSGVSYAGESAGAGPACARTPSLDGGAASTPPPPINLSVTRTGVGSGIVALQVAWADQSSNETSFQIWRGEQVLDTVGANVTSYTDSTWSASQVNCYRVVAVNQAGASASSQVCDGGDAGTRPSAPTNLTLQNAGTREVQLQWADTSSNERGFHVIGSGTVISTLDANVTTYTDPNPSSGCYAVEAFNSYGDARSNQVCNP